MVRIPIVYVTSVTGSSVQLCAYLKGVVRIPQLYLEFSIEFVWEMSPYELCHRILIALIAAVGWFKGETLRQQPPLGPVTRTNVVQHPVRQGYSESSSRTEHGPDVLYSRSPETQIQPVKKKISGRGNRTNPHGL
nr:hypothetical protein CFP56_43374 [Quercus suber]